MVAEYALSGIEKPMRVGEYQLVRSLPQSLDTNLPAIEVIEAGMGDMQGDDAGAQQSDLVSQAKKLLGIDYNKEESPEANIMSAIRLQTFPRANPVTLSLFVFDLGRGEEITFPANVTLNCCKVKSGNVSFSHGTVDAIGRYALLNLSSG